MKRNNTNEQNTVKEIIKQIQTLNETKKLKKKKYLTEERGSDDAVAITNDPKFGQNVLSNQIASFKQAVHGGAKFSNENPDNPKSNPLVYFPKTGNLVFSGSIPSLAGLKFQFSLNDVTNAPYIFAEGLSLTEETIITLNKMKGFYENWKDEWFAAGDLLSKL